MKDKLFGIFPFFFCIVTIPLLIFVIYRDGHGYVTPEIALFIALLGLIITVWAWEDTRK